ncbi:MAG: C4-type zinc ribbon domain-containing protein [Deltaproteobacteria bacterium]|nr:C4-type zinc ribbon domain-containing protein [Deltaproteobacteria bacterium]
MSLYIQQIAQLVALQKVDDAIHILKTELEQAPQEVGMLEERFAALEDQRAKISDKLEHLQEQQKRLVMEIDDDATRMKKSKSKLMQVGNTREYHAMLREMDNIEKSNRTREEEKLTLHEALQIENANLEEVVGAHQSLKAELEEKRDTLQARIDTAQVRLDVLLKERAAAGGEIPPPVFSRYEFIRHRLEHPVIVSVNQGVCSGCHIAIPPQTFIELQRGQQILSCPNCQRLIYWDEHFGAPERA